MPPPLPPRPNAWQRAWARWRHRGADPWHALVGLPPLAGERAAWRLANAGTLPDPNSPLPVPAWWSTGTLRAVALGDRDAEPPQPPWQALTPWLWAWLHHPQGALRIDHDARRAVAAGHAPLLDLLIGHVAPGGHACRGGVHRPLFELLWRRPVLGAGHDGGWQHTLDLWRVWHAAHAPMDRATAQRYAARTLAPPGPGRGNPYHGTSFDRYRWRAPQFQAWHDQGYPPPTAALALWLSGFGPAAPQAWEGWLHEGFAADFDGARRASEAQARTALLTIERLWGVPEDQRCTLMDAWLTSDRGLAPSVVGAWPRDGRVWDAQEEAWARALGAPTPPCPPPQGWLHRLAGSVGAARVGVPALAAFDWCANDPQALGRTDQGALAWERLERGIAARAPGWSASDQAAAAQVVGWLRGQQRSGALENAWRSGTPPLGPSRL